MDEWEIIEVDLNALVGDAEHAAGAYFANKDRPTRDAHFRAWAQSMAHMPDPLVAVAAEAFNDRISVLARQN